MDLQPVLKSLGAIERNLEEAATRQRELADRVHALEQRPTADHAALEAKAATDTGIVKVHNAGANPYYLLSNKAKVADVIKAQRPDVSLGRFLAAGLLGDKCGDADALRYARDVKAMTTATSGLVIPTQYMGDWIDLLRSQMVLNQAGITTVIMTGKSQSHAAVTADPTVAWHAEGTADIDEANPTFAARTFTAKTVVSKCTASVEATQDSPNFGDQLAHVMTRAIANEIDRVGLVGAGSATEPRGLYSTSGINEVTGVGTITDYAEVIQGVQALLEDNVPLEDATKFAVMSPRTWSRFENLATGITSDKTQLVRPRSIQNTQFLTTTAIPNTQDTDKSSLFLGHFPDLAMGVRLETELKAVEVSSFTSSLVIEFIAYSRVDFVAVRPSSFCVLKGIA
ncbi:MAG: phage major capsid protein [Steroidobacteraceae bacterium]|jgi:HK97 family phage major capsid protein|nr:phage major capsid protein [Steroidobacteraceae bacterium]